MNIGAAVHEVPVHIEGDPSASSTRTRAGRRRVIDLEPIPPQKANTVETEDAALFPGEDHRGRIIDLRV